MAKTKKFTRRHFIQLAGASGATTVIAACTSQPAPSAVAVATKAQDGAVATTATSIKNTVAPSVTPIPAPSTEPSDSFNPDVEIALTALESTATIFANSTTDVWRIEGKLLKGDATALQPIPDSYLAPIIRVKQGQKVRIHFNNQLTEESIIHWHGLDVPANMDGHPQYAIDGGQTYVYEFEVRNRAGTYWYHPHPHGRTGAQVYAGMAGLFLVSDAEEAALNLPSGAYELPLVLQDRRFDNANELVYLGRGMMDQMMGFLGDVMLVNGKPNLAIPVETRGYRLRLLNGSNSRIYKLGWDDGSPITVIATYGGLLAKPVERPYVTLAPAERVEFWVDFGDRPLNSSLKLINLPFSAGEVGSGEFPIVAFNIEKTATEQPTLPTVLSAPALLSAANASKNREVVLQMKMRQGWTLNGRTFEMTGVANDEKVKANSLEIWEFINQTGSGGGGGMGMGGGMMGSLPHPIHMHGESFQVIERSIDNNGRAAWEDLSAGFVDEGWKDTVLVMPGERVKVLRRFGEFTG
ncbi:MAG TPA: multicopper oxidase family protein, partial [Anaerolineae bacterium]|nr:multicopper oxidase family protein [Anaerolineae bacterium]